MWITLAFPSVRTFGIVGWCRIHDQFLYYLIMQQFISCFFYQQLDHKLVLVFFTSNYIIKQFFFYQQLDHKVLKQFKHWFIFFMQQQIMQQQIMYWFMQLFKYWSIFFTILCIGSYYIMQQFILYFSVHPVVAD